ncbi:Integration host factor subunit alpha [Alphaproteobacteria bacterium]
MLKRSTVTREFIAKVMSKSLQITAVTAHQYVDTIFDVIVKTLAAENSLKIRQFGSFSIKHKNQRIGRNPKTKDAKIIHERNVVRFKIADVFRKRINDNLHMVLFYHNQKNK